MLKTKLIGGMTFLAAVLLTASCARGVDDESFVTEVTNTQLKSPTIDEASFSILTNPDGTESIKLTWPVIHGAGGYLCNVQCIENPEDETVTSENPTVVVNDSIVDGCSLAFLKTEDAVYNISVKTVGNDRLNNTDAAEATTYQYSALIPATTIPAGSDIAEYINANLTSSDKEQGFALEAGASYTLNAKVDFGLNQITLRSTDKEGKHPRVTVGAEGALVTQAGLKIKFIDFDCTNATQKGFIMLSNEPDASLSTESLGYKELGANKDGYVINDPVIIQDCNIKNLNKSIICANGVGWSLRDFRIKNCIIQLKNSTNNPILDMQGGNGLIKSLIIENNTIYNIEKNSSAPFLKYQAATVPKGIFGNNDSDSNVTITNNTFYQTMSSYKFADRIPNTNTIVTTIENNIFYEVKQVYQITASQGKSSYKGNIMFGNATDSNDVGGKKDSNGNQLATELDPQFVGPTAQELDLDQPNGGVNFKPSAAEAANAGDPRWL